MRDARREYGNTGTVHLFIAARARVAMLVGQSLNTFGTVQTYEHLSNMGAAATSRQRFFIPALNAA
jgi:SMODS-associated and fused to various effectors sensor domain